MTEFRTMTYKHGEAFMLMWYACEKCGHRERIWNSRDGVTPFGCGCPSCGSILNHVDWGEDVRAVDYQLHNHQHFWRDGTPDEAEAIMRRRIERMEGQITEYPLSPEEVADLIQKSRDGSTGEFQAGWPMLGEHRL